MALRTSEIWKVMRRDPAFLGVFAFDRVPHSLKKGDVKMVINMDTADKPGSHWVAIWRRNNKGFYYDSFGRPPPKDIIDWLTKNTSAWEYNYVPMQSPKDKSACGYLCISFLTNKFKM